MKNREAMRQVVGAMLIGLVAATTVQAQDAAEAERKQAEAAAIAKVRAEQNAIARVKAEQEMLRKTPLQVQVVISSYQGEKRISSMPYVLAVNAVSQSFSLQSAENSRLRMGARVPVTAMPGAIGPVTYEDIGTSIDCRARAVGDGFFELSISLEDKSVYASDQGTAASAGGSAGPAAPVFRTFQTGNVLTLRDGQTRQFTAATDRVSGEVMRVEVTLTVVQ